MNKLNTTLFILYCIICLACTSKQNKEWHAPFPTHGTQSSPRCTDLNRDGILDIVIGGGRNEYFQADYGVLALNGKNGAVLWKTPSTDQIIGSSTFLDINSDGIEDVIIGGRSHNLFALNGQDGTVIWKYEIVPNDSSIKAYARFNFFNNLLVPDLNGDGIQDVLTANGGNAKAQPNSMSNRFPGTLMILDSKTGEIMAIDTMPDGLENYMSPVKVVQDSQVYIIYGTGGETFGGGLYKTRLKDLMQNNLKVSKQLIRNIHQGFIAPPNLVDLTGDNIPEIIAASHNGVIYCMEGLTDSLLWTQELRLEANNMLAAGYFDQDAVFDFFGYFSQGTWPNNDGIKAFVLNGLNGKILFLDSIGSFGFSSPLAFQADEDKEHEVLLHINYGKPNTLAYDQNKSQLLLFDFPGFKKIEFSRVETFKNISTTPWLGDLDGDQYLDLVTCYLKNTYKMDEVNGMFISKMGTTWSTKLNKKPIFYLK